MRYDFFRQQMKAYPVTMLCRVMQVSRSGFYQYHRHYRDRVQDPEQMALESLMWSIFKASKENLRILHKLPVGVTQLPGG